MLVEVKVPQLAESVSEATVLAWQKAPGGTVEQGELLVELETDKVVLEVTAPADGLLRDIHKPEGEAVTTGEVLASIDPDYAAEERSTEEEPPQVMSRPAPEPAPAAAGAGEAPPEPSQPAQAAPPPEPPAGPSARRRMAEHGLSAAQVTGTGRGGRVMAADVDAHLAREGSRNTGAPQAPAPSPTREDAAAPAGGPAPGAPGGEAGGRGERREPMSRLRRRVAERLVEVQRDAAILTTFNEVDMSAVMGLRRRYRDAFEQRHGARLGFMGFFVKAAVRALERFPKVNAYLEGDEVVYHDYCDLGIAVGSERGLLVPVVRDVQRLGIAEIETRIADFGRRAQSGRIAPEELAGGTFTITNGGVFGSLLSTPILNPPQTAILGMHKIQDRPVAVDGQVVIRPMMYLALSYDHRIIDGREAVQFLVTIKESLEDPARLLLDV